MLRHFPSELSSADMDGYAVPVFLHRGFKDAFNNYCWVVKRCWNLGFVCPSEARWWIISKVKRFFWKKSIGIDWRIPTEHANLSEKDTKHEVLKDFESPFEY